MKFSLTVALFLSAGASTANVLYPYELHKCQGRDQFTYWTTPPCAAGDRSIATSSADPFKPMSEQIRAAECKLQALRQSTKNGLATATTSKGPETAHCD